MPRQDHSPPGLYSSVLLQLPTLQLHPYSTFLFLYCTSHLEKIALLQVCTVAAPIYTVLFSCINTLLSCTDLSVGSLLCLDKVTIPRVCTVAAPTSTVLFCCIDTVLSRTAPHGTGGHCTVFCTVKCCPVLRLQMDSKLSVETLDVVLNLALNGCKALGQRMKEVRAWDRVLNSAVVVKPVLVGGFAHRRKERLPLPYTYGKHVKRWFQKRFPAENLQNYAVVFLFRQCERDPVPFRWGLLPKMLCAWMFHAWAILFLERRL